MKDADKGISHKADTMTAYFLQLTKSSGLTWRTITTYLSTAITSKWRMEDIDNILLIRSMLRQRGPLHEWRVSKSWQAMISGIAQDPEKKSAHARLVKKMFAGVRRTFFFQTKNTTKQLIATIKIDIKPKNEKNTTVLLCCPVSLSSKEAFVIITCTEFRCAIQISLPSVFPFNWFLGLENLCIQILRERSMLYQLGIRSVKRLKC